MRARSAARADAATSIHAPIIQDHTLAAPYLSWAVYTFSAIQLSTVVSVLYWRAWWMGGLCAGGGMLVEVNLLTLLEESSEQNPP